MNDKNNQMKEWIEKTYQFSLPRWEDLPDIDLYMDQVMWVFKKQFAYMNDAEIEKLMSPSMINNYVKANVVNRPNNKKYSRAQLSQLFQIALLKSTLSMDQIKVLQECSKKYDTPSSQFNAFIQRANEVFHQELLSTKEALVEESAFIQLAFELALEAGMKKIIADQIISLLMENKPPKEGTPKKEKASKTTK